MSGNNKPGSGTPVDVLAGILQLCQGSTTAAMSIEQMRATTTADQSRDLAGEEGFEPSNGGSKEPTRRVR
jgi:hypothetical protein